MPQRKRNASSAAIYSPKKTRANSHTSVTVNTNDAAIGLSSIDADTTMSFEKDEEAETERLLQERRRRRKEIMNLHKMTTATNQPTLPNTNTDRASKLPPPQPKINSDSQKLGQKRVTNNNNEDDEDMFDMFADDNSGQVFPQVDLGKCKSVNSSAAVSASASAMADSWDDAEGYYRTIVGELLNKRYRVKRFLGQGVFSSVIMAADTSDNDKPVAIKVIRQNEVMQRAGLKEKRMLERLASADPSDKMHIVRMLGSFTHKGHLCLCFELMHQNLREVVRKYGRGTGLNLEAVRIYAVHMLLALDHLRRCQVIHGDIKPDNCFISEQKNMVKLGDLGSACDISEREITPYLVSRFYRAPEVILGIPYDYSIDVWSLGVTLFELFTGKIMFPGKNNNHMLELMMEAKGHIANRMLRRGQLWQQHFEDNGGSAMDFVSRSKDKVTGMVISKQKVFSKPTNDIKTQILQAVPAGALPGEIQMVTQFAALLSDCLELNPDKRITPIEALKHPFFKK